MVKKPKHFTVPLVIYPIDIMVSLCEDDKTVSEFSGFTLDDIKLSEEEAAKTFYIDGRVLIRFTSYPKTPQEKGDEAHEIFHAVCYVMSYIGMRFTDKGKEAYSYLIDYITTEIEKNLK